MFPPHNEAVYGRRQQSGQQNEQADGLEAKVFSEDARRARQDRAAQPSRANLKANRIRGMIAADARRRLRDEKGEDGRQAKADAQQADETEDIADVDEEQSRAQNSQAKAGVEQPPVPNPQRQQTH